MLFEIILNGILSRAMVGLGRERAATVGGLQLVDFRHCQIGRSVLWWVRILVGIRVRCLFSLLTVCGCALEIVFDIPILVFPNSYWLSSRESKSDTSSFATERAVKVANV